jgi:hypothetical protein
VRGTQKAQVHAVPAEKWFSLFSGDPLDNEEFAKTDDNHRFGEFANIVRTILAARWQGGSQFLQLVDGRHTLVVAGNQVRHFPGNLLSNGRRVGRENKPPARRLFSAIFDVTCDEYHDHVDHEAAHSEIAGEAAA